LVFRAAPLSLWKVCVFLRFKKVGEGEKDKEPRFFICHLSIFTREITLIFKISSYLKRLWVHLLLRKAPKPCESGFPAAEGKPQVGHKE
jgi:hypothetical protein